MDYMSTCMPPEFPQLHCNLHDSCRELALSARPYRYCPEHLIGIDLAREQPAPRDIPAYRKSHVLQQPRYMLINLLKRSSDDLLCASWSNELCPARMTPSVSAEVPLRRLFGRTLCRHPTTQIDYLHWFDYSLSTGRRIVNESTSVSMLAFVPSHARVSPPPSVR